MLRKNAGTTSVEKVLEQLKGAELALLSAASNDDCLVLKTLVEIAAMHRALRKMRYAIEVEAGLR